MTPEIAPPRCALRRRVAKGGSRDVRGYPIASVCPVEQSGRRARQPCGSDASVEVI